MKPGAPDTSDELIALYRLAATETADPAHDFAVLAAARSRPPRSARTPWTKLAATFALVVGASALLWRLTPDPPDPLPPTGYGLEEGRDAAYLAGLPPVAANPSGSAEYLLHLDPTQPE